MKQEINISWHIENEDGAVKKSHCKELKDAVMRRINEMMAEGYREGELIENICMGDEDGEDGVEYHGWWSTKKETFVNDQLVML